MMGFRGVVAFILLACVVYGDREARAQTNDPPRHVLQRFCFSCHNDRARTGGLALDVLEMTRVGENADVWEAVIKKLRTGAMPPVGRPRPDNAEAEMVVTWLEAELDRAALASPNPGRPTLHRLNRAEYRNAIRDLLAVDIDASLLPADNAAYGFDNNADALTLSSALTERYLSAAAKVSQIALGRPTGSPSPETIFVATDSNQDGRVSDDLPLGSRGGTAFRYYFGVDGDYRFEFRPEEGGVEGGFEGVTTEPHEIHVSLDDEHVWTGIVGGPDYEGLRGDEKTRKVLETLQFDAPVTAGSHLVQVFFRSKTSAYIEDLFDPSLRRDPYRARNGEPVVASVAITGPLAESAVVSETPSRRKLLICTPGSAAEQESCAEQILSTLARRAYRRPLTDSDLEVPLALYRQNARSGGFESGIELAVRSILVSPNFLFRVEGQPATVPPNTPYRISDLELASRLSFFLWSSVPDDELIDLASTGQLRDPLILERQTRRMLADERASALVTNFASQWLYLRNVPALYPDEDLFPHVGEVLRQAMQRETELFVEDIFRRDQNVMTLLTADYTFVNERLARHYDIPHVYGSHFRRVSLDQAGHDARRGLLGHASILAVTAYPNRTSPVLRGKWVLENLLGTPPASPPADVPSLEETTDNGEILSMREATEQHRANPACASCHRLMDPPGFALEQFDAVGRFRTHTAANTLIDATGELPDGTQFDGAAGLREALVASPARFVGTLTEKLMIYALGRGLEHYDAPIVRSIVRDVEEDNYRFSSIILGIVKSPPFRMRRTES